MPLDGRIYMLTVGSVLTTNVSQTSLCQLLLRATIKVRLDPCLSLDNFDCTKMIARFQNFTACLREGLIHKWKQALLAPPSPLMLVKKNSQFCSTHSHR